MYKLIYIIIIIITTTM